MQRRSVACVIPRPIARNRRDHAGGGGNHPNPVVIEVCDVGSAEVIGVIPSPGVMI
jgi:hypothetical protein